MIVVLLSMPLLPSNSSSFLIGTMSRISVSQSSVVQFHPAAPGTWPWSYAVVSTSTSTTRTPVSAACCATQSVVTRTLGIVAADIIASFAKPSSCHEHDLQCHRLPCACRKHRTHCDHLRLRKFFR